MSIPRVTSEGEIVRGGTQKSQQAVCGSATDTELGGTGNRRYAIQLAGTEWDTGEEKVDVWLIFRRRAGVVPKRFRKASTKWEGLRKPTVAAITVIGSVPCRRISRAVFRRIDRMNSCVDCPVIARNRRFKCILLIARLDAAAAVVKRGSAMCASTVASTRARKSSSRLPPPS